MPVRRSIVRLLASGTLAALAAGGTVVAAALPTTPPTSTGTATAEQELLLSYASPATSWENESLPIGNGALGASVFGGVGTDRIQLNEKTLWSGGPGVDGYDYGTWDREDRPTALQDVRDRIDAEGEVSATWVAEQLGLPKTGYGSYQPFGELRLTVPDSDGYTDYRRTLDLNSAVAGVEYTVDGVDFTREYLASYPDDVVVTHLTADADGAIDLTAGLETQIGGGTVTVEDGRITFTGALPDNGLEYHAEIQVVTKGGTRTDGATEVVVSGADSATIIWSGGTSYAPVYPDYREADRDAHADRVTAAVTAAAEKGWAAIRADHVANHRALFDRVRLDVQGAEIDVPTDVALAEYTGASARDRSLEALFFQYGRYLLIASSRPGSLPANLQGVWNNQTAAPWGADYHTNINLQMNYWPAHSTNLAETYEPYLDYIESLVPAGRDSAERMLGMDGWTVHNETTPWGFTGVHDWATAFWFPEATAWLAVDFYREYLYSGDEAFLAERAYPLLRETSEFWLDYLVPDERDDLLVANPSYSPEHGEFTAGAAMSQQLATEVLSATVAAADTLGVDEEFRDEVAATLDTVDPGLRVGSWGQLQEWKEDIDRTAGEPQHRHVSQLYALFPGDAISTDETPELADAARVTLNDRGDGGTGWSKAWKINFWANLRDGNRAHKMLREQLMHSTLPNLWDTHPPFQIDGNFGATSGVAEMLVQSNRGEVSVLPALPDAWATGSFDGLRGEGGLTLGASWNDGAATELRVVPDRSGDLTLRSDVFAGPFTVLDDAGTPVPATVEGDRATWEGVAGTRYTVVSEAGLVLTGPAELVPGETAEYVATVTTRSGDLDGELVLRAPEGWAVSPLCTAVTQPGDYTFSVTAPSDGTGPASLTAELTTAGWELRSGRVVTIVPPPPEHLLPQEDLTVTASSEQLTIESTPVGNMVDGDPATLWHSSWSASPGPHHVTIGLDGTHRDLAVRYLPRQAGNTNGMLRDYAVHVSADGEDWGEPVLTGTLPEDRGEQVLELPQEVAADHLRIVWESSYSDDGHHASAAEINVQGVPLAGTPEPTPSAPAEPDPGTCAPAPTDPEPTDPEPTTEPTDPEPTTEPTDPAPTSEPSDVPTEPSAPTGDASEPAGDPGDGGAADVGAPGAGDLPTTGVTTVATAAALALALLGAGTVTLLVRRRRAG